MLVQQQIQLSGSSDLYKLIVPKDNLLRKINELLNKYGLNNGRNAESPIKMFKYFLTLRDKNITC
jgi:hypothetical protein